MPRIELQTERVKKCQHNICLRVIPINKEKTKLPHCYLFTSFLFLCLLPFNSVSNSFISTIFCYELDLREWSKKDEYDPTLQTPIAIIHFAIPLFIVSHMCYVQLNSPFIIKQLYELTTI